MCSVTIDVFKIDYRIQNLKTILPLIEQIGTPEIQIYLNQTKYILLYVNFKYTFISS